MQELIHRSCPTRLPESSNDLADGIRKTEVGTNRCISGCCQPYGNTLIRLEATALR